jgi:hypothetical protein
MNKKELEGRAESIRSCMREIDQIIQGSMVLREAKCGKANCKCNRGELHESWCITYKEKGKTRTVYVDREKIGEALLMCANYKKIKELIKELTSVNLELIRSRRKK